VDGGAHWKIVTERVKRGLCCECSFGAETQAEAYATSGAEVEEGGASQVGRERRVGGILVRGLGG
jgi:hypothetical protein